MLASKLERLPCQCYWPDEIVEKHANTYYETDDFIAVLEESKMYKGYKKLYWAGRDSDSVNRGILQIIEQHDYPLHTTVCGNRESVDSLLDIFKDAGFSLQDIHVEMICPKLPKSAFHNDVKPACSKSAPIIATLCEKVFDGHSVLIEEDILEKLVSNKHITLYVSVDDVIAGAISGEVYGENLDRLFVLTLAVLPQFRRRGLGHQLLESFIAWGKSQGSEKSMLWLSDIHNIPAKRLYESFGYKDTGGREVELLRD